MPQPTTRPFTAFEERLVTVGSKLMSRANIWLIRATGGRYGTRFMYGAPIMLVTTTGRRSGEPRTSPLLYLRDGDTLVTVASKGGSATNPAWYGNMLANPNVEVEIDGAKRAMQARTASAEEKARYWSRLTEIYPPYASYQSRTAREIPVVVLTPR